MNSTEHLDHVAETNNSLLFPAIFKQSWGVFKKKWFSLFTLALIPVIFLAAIYLAVGLIVYIGMKISGIHDISTALIATIQNNPNYISNVFTASTIIAVIGLLYFSIRSTIASVKILESQEKITVRHAWKGISFKSILSFLWVSIILGVILMGGYILLFVPLLFLVTFYSNAVFANIIEGKKGIDALVVSRNYVRGYGAIIFVNFLAVLGVGIIFGMIFRLALGLGGLMMVSVYFGKISIGVAMLVFILGLILSILLLALWKAFAFIVIYSMFKKLQTLKGHHVFDLNKNRKTVKVWLILSIASVAIFVGVSAALSHNKVQQNHVSQDDSMIDASLDQDYNY